MAIQIGTKIAIYIGIDLFKTTHDHLKEEG